MTELLRRDLLVTTAGALFASQVYEPIARLLDVETRAFPHVGATDVDRLARRTRVIQASGNTGAILDPPSLRAEFERAARLLKGRFASDTVRLQVHGAAALVTKYVGWNLYYHGRQDDARRMWIAALVMAREADPSVAPVVQAAILQDMAHQAITAREYQKALRLLGMAFSEEAALPSLQRANLSVVRAGATAGLGKVDETRRHIGWAQEHIDDAADDRDAGWWNVNGWFGVADLNGVASRAMSTLALSHGYQREDAIGHAKVALDSFRPDNVRPRANAANTLVKLHAANRDVAETEKVGMLALDTVRRARSAKATADLYTVRPYLEPMIKNRKIADLDHGIELLTRQTH